MRLKPSLVSYMQGLAVVLATAFTAHAKSTEDSLTGGNELMKWILRAEDLPSSPASPRHLERYFGVTLASPFEEQGSIGRRSYEVMAAHPDVALEHASYVLTWGARANNGTQLRLPIRRSGACITEDMVQASTEAELTRTLSGHRRLMPGQTLPEGMLPYVEVLAYSLNNGAVMEFWFDSECAFEIHILQPQAPDWKPQ